MERAESAARREILDGPSTPFSGRGPQAAGDSGRAQPGEDEQRNAGPVVNRRRREFGGVPQRRAVEGEERDQMPRQAPAPRVDQHADGGTGEGPEKRREEGPPRTAGDSGADNVAGEDAEGHQEAA